MTCRTDSWGPLMRILAVSSNTLLSKSFFALDPLERDIAGPKSRSDTETSNHIFVASITYYFLT